MGLTSGAAYRHGLLTVMSFGAGVAPNMDILLVLRFLQGMAAAMALLTSSVYLGLTLGPLIGGGIVTLFHWRWLFWLWLRLLC